VPNWQEIKSVALAAHNACPDRLLVGWDIALTPDGAVLLEGNAYPDVDFLQRVHRCPLGSSPMGAPLYHRLVELEHRIAAGTVRGAKDFD
ncbi:MAG: sugar-transfer associated ATP-grasp domain-containing protein, partial [Dongiaceae bacterium]